MDPLTQATLGAATAQIVARPRHFWRATWAGALGGFLPDVDVLIRSSGDPLLFLDYHRHFTHSLCFIPLGGALTAGVCSLLARGRVRFRALVLPCSLGWASHGLLDACTSYGTSLYWPISSERVAWQLIAIVDPAFTLPLLVGVIWAVRRRSPWIARAFLVLALGYLGLGLVQRQRAAAIHQDLIAARGHEARRPTVKPSMANNILFRAFYEHDGAYHVDAIRVPWLGEPRVYPGDRHPALDVERYVAQHDLDAVQATDLDRFALFSADWLIEDPRHDGVISDFRYAMLPNDIAPLWGVDVAGTPAGQHLAWRELREIDAQDRARFIDMLWGR